MTDPHHLEPSLSVRCLCERTEVRRRTIRGGTVTVGRQCLTCGQWRAIPKTGHVVESLPEYDPGIGTAYYDAISQRHRQAWEQKVRAEEQEWRRRYNLHLNSDKWRAIRAKVLSRAGGMCEGCGVQQAVQVHHLHYKRLGNEMLFDLVAVCLVCHEQIHEQEA